MTSFSGMRKFLLGDWYEKCVFTLGRVILNQIIGAGVIDNQRTIKKDEYLVGKSVL